MYEMTQKIEQTAPMLAPRDIADFAFLMRKAADFLDDAKKACNKAYTALGNAGVDLILQKGDGEPLRGQYASGWHSGKVSVNVPGFDKDPEKYARLCEILGVEAHPLTRLHYPSIETLLSGIVASGQKLQPELAEFKQYSTTTFITKENKDSTLR